MDKDTKQTIIIYLITGIVCILFLAIITTISAWMFNTIMASDMPDWLKYVLLK